MNLFKFEGYRITVMPEAMTLVPFKRIWNRDRTAGKDRALAEMGYIYFMCDPRSDYQYIMDGQERHKAVIDGEGLPEDWKPDKYVKEAMEFYSGFRSTAALLLEDTKMAVEKVRKLLREIDLSAVDDKGKPIYNLSNITSTIRQIPGLVKDLDEAERALALQIREQGKMRGQGEKTLMEDSLDD